MTILTKASSLIALLTIFAPLLLPLSCRAKNLQALRQEYCDGVTLSSSVLPDAEYDRLRNKTKNPFFSGYKHIFEYYQDRKASTFLAAFGWEAGLFIAVIIIILVTFIIFAFAVCFFKGILRNGPLRLFFYSAVVLFVIFIILFVTILVYIGLATSDGKRARCQLYNVPATVIWGSAGSAHGQEFIGYYPFENFIS